MFCLNISKKVLNIHMCLLLSSGGTKQHRRPRWSYPRRRPYLTGKFTFYHTSRVLYSSQWAVHSFLMSERYISSWTPPNGTRGEPGVWVSIVEKHRASYETWGDDSDLHRESLLPECVCYRTWRKTGSNRARTGADVVAIFSIDCRIDLYYFTLGYF